MKNYPFLGNSLVFIAGILTNYFFKIAAHSFFILLIFLSIAVILGYLFFENKPLTFIPIICFYLFLFSLGNYLYAEKIETKSFLPKEIETIEKLVVIGFVQSIDLRKEKEISFEIKTDSIRINNVYQSRDILLLCRVRDSNENLDRLYNKLLPGNEVRIEGTFLKGREDRNPGEFNYDAYLKTKGISGIFFINEAYDIKIINWHSDVILTHLFNTRKFIDSKIKSLHNREAAALLRGLLLADRSGIDYETKTKFVNSGVMHILAVSGLHVGFIALIFIILLGRFNIFLRSIITIVGLVLFLFLTGMPPSVFRAVVMAVVIIIAYITNRSANIFNSLAIAAFIVLAFNPEELFNAGFQLSFIAVLSIAVIYPLVQKFINSLKINSKSIKYILLFMGVSFSAQLGTLPLILIYFGKLSLVSLFTNLIVIPLVGVVVSIAIFTLVISFLIPAIAMIYASANEILIFILFKIISFAGGNQLSFIPIEHFTIFDTAIFYAAAILLILGLTKLKSTLAKIIFMIFILANAILFGSFDNVDLLEKGKLSVLMIDLGKGDAALIKFPNGHTALINAGYASFKFDNGDRVIKPLLEHLEIDKIDYAFLLSSTQVSFGGFVSLIKNGFVKNIFKLSLDSSSIVDVKLEDFVNDHMIPLNHFNKEALEISEAKMYFLPDEYLTSINRSGHNKTCAIKLLYGKTSILFSGEMDKSEENNFTDYYKNFLKSDVLIISNNGKTKKMSVEFLQKVLPKIILVNVSKKNKFDKSSQSILEQLSNFSSNVYRTDEDGAIILHSDGEKISRIIWK